VRPDDLIAATDPKVVADVQRGQGSAPAKSSWKPLLGAAMFSYIGLRTWAIADEHGHHLARVFVACVLVAATIAWLVRQRPRSSAPLPSGPSSWWIWGGVIGAMAAVTLAGWWGASQDGTAAGVLFGLGFGLFAIAVGAYTAAWVRGVARLGRALAAGRDPEARARQRATERERVAWGIANGPAAPVAAILADWLSHRPAPLQAQVAQVAPIPLDHDPKLLTVWAGAGLRRVTSTGDLAVEARVVYGATEGVDITAPGGFTGLITNAKRRLGGRHDWQDHAHTVVVAELAAGPAWLVWAHDRDHPDAAGTTTIVLGGSGQPVPAVTAADAGLRIAPTRLRVEPRPGCVAPMGITRLSEAMAPSDLEPSRRLGEQTLAEFAQRLQTTTSLTVTAAPLRDLYPLPRMRLTTTEHPARWVDLTLLPSTRNITLPRNADLLVAVSAVDVCLNYDLGIDTGERDAIAAVANLLAPAP
jgi:hypothetical protein